MRTHTLRVIVAAAALFLLAWAAAAAEPVLYELRFGKPNTHLLEITVRASGLRGPAAEFAMPAWAPGAYGIGDYAKNVQEFRATGPGERALAWRKTDKQTWRVELGGGATTVTVRYKLYGNTLGNTRVQYNEKHAHIAGPAAWMYLVGGKERPVQLKIEAPAGWKVATGLERTGENTFAAADYDWLNDSPIEISDYAEKTFTTGGATYHVVVHDVMGRKDFTRFTEDTKKIVEAIVPIFAPAEGGGRTVPFQDYWFLFHVWPNSGGGLEHLNSTQINLRFDWDDVRPVGRDGTAYDSKLAVTSHEFFHTWNVKRLRPRPLGPFDYSREVYTPSLWISEGITSYYGDLVLVRAGLWTPEHYLNSISQLLTEFEREPGRKERGIEDTSWDTWFSSTGAENNLANTDYSYYDGGQIVGHLLDFALRQVTDNQKSLDDWMRLLYRRHGLPKPGFEPEDAVRAFNEVAGKDMSELFRRYITDKEPLPYDTFFGYAGIRVERKLDPNRAWLGVAAVRNEDGRARITNVIPGSPAEQAGLDRGDVIVAVDGKTRNAEEFVPAIEARTPGETVKLTVIRLGELKEIEATLRSDPHPIYKLKPAESPSEQQKRIYESWLGRK